MNTVLVQKYADEFWEKVFYFCVKKCSNPIQAEDLVSDINYSILNALRSNFIPQNYHAWVWAVARNQYSKWAAGTNKNRMNILPGDIGEYDVAVKGYYLSFSSTIVLSIPATILAISSGDGSKPRISSGRLS